MRICLSVVLVLTIGSAPLAAAKPVVPVPAIPGTIAAADPARDSMIDELRAAKSSHNVSALHDVEMRMGTVVAAPVQAPKLVTRVYTYDGKFGERDNARWGGDVCVTCPWTVTGDPALACGSDGAQYAAAQSADAHAIYVFRSSDGGASWQLLLGTSSDATVGEPCLAVGEGNLNRLLCAFVRGSGSSSASLEVLTFDLDTGLTNITTALWCPSQQLAHPRICVDSPEWALWYPYVVCLVQGASTSEVHFTRSIDYGNQWTTPVMLVSGVTLDDRDDIDFGGGTLTVAFTQRNADSDVLLRISRDFGQTFEPAFAVMSAGYEEYEPRIATTITGDMTLVVFAREYSSGNRDIDCVWSADAGTTWNASYLPYSWQDERRPAVVASPLTGRLQAAYWCAGEIRYTWADAPLVPNWSVPLTVNDRTASGVAWPAIALRLPTCGCNPDMNCDGVVDANDIGPFNLAMTDPILYAQTYPNCDINQADTDCDGDIDTFDLDRLECLIDGLPDCCPDPGGDVAVAWLGDGPFTPGIWLDFASSHLPISTAVPPPGPLAAGLSPNYPNPFNPRTTVSFMLLAAGQVQLAIYDARGMEVARLVDESLPAGAHAVDWDGRDAFGAVMPSGTYFCRLATQWGVENRKLQLVR